MIQDSNLKGYLLQKLYRVTHLVANLGWVDLDLGSSYLLPKQDGGTSQIKVNPTQVRHQMCHPVLKRSTIIVIVYNNNLLLRRRGCGHTLLR